MKDLTQGSIPRHVIEMAAPMAVGMFQAKGNTWPVMLSSATRLLTFVVPVVWVSQTPTFVIEDFWILSVTAVVVQAVTSYRLLRREFGRRLAFPAETPVSEPG